MRPTSVFLVLTLSAMVGCQSGSGSNGGASPGASSGGGESGDVRRTVTGLLDQYTQALLKHDYATLERLWADDLTFINNRGALLTKQQRLANLRSGATKFEAIDVNEQVVRPAGADAAISTSRIDIKGQYSGQEGSGPYRVTVVWARRQGNWQIAAIQMTRIEQ